MREKMKRICVIGGANADIAATTMKEFVPNDSNPGTIRLMPGGVGRNIAHNLALLGNEVVFLTLFGGDTFGLFTADSCRKVGVNISLCDNAPVGTRSCFLSINNCDGEMVGGVSDMRTADGITPEWIASKLSKLDAVDAFVADTNIPVESLAYLIDQVVPLYVDAVSGPKAPKIIEAMRLSRKKSFFALKCNQLEWEVLREVKGIQRCFISLGADGLEVLENGQSTRFDALPCKEVVNTTGAGDALMAGIVHAGPEAPLPVAATTGLRCAKITVETPDTVNNRLKELYEQIP